MNCRAGRRSGWALRGRWPGSRSFIVCDEAVSALDVSVQAQVINLLMDLQERMGLTYLFISHNLAVVRHISDRVGVMYLGRLAELAPRAELFARPLHPYTQRAAAAVPEANPRAPQVAPAPERRGAVSPLNPPQGCRFHTRCPIARDTCRSAVPDWREVAPGHHVACHAVAGPDRINWEGQA
jgi:peptide/nickel transport system ATP-binding protein